MYVPRLWDLLLTSRFSGAFAATTTQFSNSCVYTLYPQRRRVVSAACSHVVQDHAPGTQRLAPHCFGPAPQELAHPSEEIAE